MGLGSNFHDFELDFKFDIEFNFDVSREYIARDNTKAELLYNLWRKPAKFVCQEPVVDMPDV